MTVELPPLTREQNQQLWDALFGRYVERDTDRWDAMKQVLGALTSRLPCPYGDAARSKLWGAGDSLTCAKILAAHPDVGFDMVLVAICLALR